jgi:hypothetical protein
MSEFSASPASLAGNQELCRHASANELVSDPCLDTSSGFRAAGSPVPFARGLRSEDNAEIHPQKPVCRSLIGAPLCGNSPNLEDHQRSPFRDSAVSRSFRVFSRCYLRKNAPGHPSRNSQPFSFTAQHGRLRVKIVIFFALRIYASVPRRPGSRRLIFSGCERPENDASVTKSACLGGPSSLTTLSSIY